MMFRNRSRKPISIGRTGAPFVASVTAPFGSLTVRPSIFSSKSGMQSPPRSMPFSFPASRSVIAPAWRTAFSAQSALRPRSSATVRMNAAASFSTFFIIVLSAPPPSATGEAAPMLVAGAIAATWAAIVMKTPAEAARAPVGATYTMTGTSALNMRWTIARIERSSPPGVSSWMTSAWARSAWARSMAMPTRRSVTGLITPSMSIVATGAGAADATLASASNATASSVAPRLEAGATEGGPRPARPGFIVASASRPAQPRVARDRRDPDSSPQRQETDELEEEIRGEQRGDLAGAVVRGRNLDDIGAHEGLPRKRPHQHERLVRCEPADLGRPGRGGECRIDGVDVERAVDRPAAEAAEPFRHPGGPLLLHRLDAHDLDPMLIVEGEVLGAVERTADPDLDHASRLDEPLLHGAAERRAVGELRAEV